MTRSNGAPAPGTIRKPSYGRAARAKGMAAAVLLAATVAGMGAQAPGASTTWSPPLTPDGQPDVSGVWESRGGGISYAIEPVAIDPYGRPTKSLKPNSAFVDPDPGGKLPFLPWARARREDIVAHLTKPLPQHIDPQTRGYPQGVPRINYQEGGITHILQSAGQVVMLYEVGHEFRVIPVDGRPALGRDIRLWMGDSRGRWEGNTLVVETANHNDRTWFSVVGEFHSEALRVVERWSFVDADTIKYRATIEDLKVYTRPWTIAFDKVRIKTAGYELLEHAAIEGERDTQLMLDIPAKARDGGVK